MLEERSPARRSLLAVVAAAAVLLLALGAGWLLTRPVTAPVADAELDARSRAANGAPVGDGAATKNAQPARTAGDDARQAADTAGATPPIALRVVDADRRPVAGANVRIDPNAAEVAFWDLQDAEPLLAAIAPQTSDEHGLVHTRLPRGTAIVVARKGEAYVQLWVDVAETITDPIELLLLDDRELVVHTQLADGTAAPHVPIELAYSWLPNARPDQLQHFVFGRTDEHGDLVVRHAQRLFRRTPAAPQLLLRPHVVGALAEATSVSLAESRTHIDLVCVPHGTIQVASFARDGQPIARPAKPNLRLLAADAAAKPCEVPAWPLATPGAWCLHPLALDIRWQVDDAHHEPIDVHGPRRHGEVVDVPLRVLRTRARLRFVVQAPDGTPLADATVRIDSDQRQATEVRTDASGGIDVERREDEASVRVEAANLHARGTLLLPASAAPLPAPLDAGSVRLERQPLLVQGVVVDAGTGAPLTAWIDVEEPKDPPVEVASTRCAEDGSFAIWGQANGPLRLKVRRMRHRDLVQVVPSGTRDLVLRLEAERHLFVTLRFDAEVDDELVDVHLEPRRDTWSSSRSEVGLRHQVRPIPSGGDNTLVVAVAGHALLRQPETAWPTSPLGAAVDVDLRGRLAMATIEVTRGGEVVDADVLLLSGTVADRAAEPIDAGRPFVLPTDQPWRALVQPEFGGMVELPLRPGRNAVEVPGPARVRCTTTHAPGALGDASVRFVLLRLRRDEPVLARIEDGDDEPPPPLPTTIAALRVDERDVTSTCTPDDDAPEGEFWISRRGHYAVFVVLQQNERNVLLAQPPVEFDVSGFDVELPIVIPLQPTALAAAREQLARDTEPR
jgi:hypothetical protein